MKYASVLLSFLDALWLLCIVSGAPSNNTSDNTSSNTISNTTKQIPSGRHVCAQEQRIAHQVPVKLSYIRPMYRQVMVACDRYRMCPRHRLVYGVAYRTVFRVKINLKQIYACCPGWARNDSSDRECLKPVCKEECLNGGHCIAPDKCKCVDGWSGNTCSKVCITCLPEYAEMKTTITHLMNQVKQLEEEKNFLMGNVSFLADHYEETMITMQELKTAAQSQTQTTTAPTTTTASQQLDQRDFIPFDRIASLSEQIAILEERLEGCTCRYMQPKPKRGRNYH